VNRAVSLFFDTEVAAEKTIEASLCPGFYDRGWAKLRGLLKLELRLHLRTVARMEDAK
jgi:hypothetical protein